MEKIPASQIVYADEEFVRDLREKLNDPVEEPQVMTVFTLQDIAKMPDVKVNEATLRAHANNYANGKKDKRCLKAKKKGRSWYVKQEDLDKYLR